MIKHCRSVLGAAVNERATSIRGIELPPVNIEQFVIGDLGRVKANLDCFQVAGPAGGNLEAAW